MMFGLLGASLVFGSAGSLLLIVSTATDYWLEYRFSGNLSHQGLWRYCVGNKCYYHTDTMAFMDATRALLLLSLIVCVAAVACGSFAFNNARSFYRLDRTWLSGLVFLLAALLVALALAVYSASAANVHAKRFTDWRFSWSYFISWAALMLTFMAGMLSMCSYQAKGLGDIDPQ
ncbi:unnamed protein product [Lampetra fluviatilis]